MKISTQVLPQLIQDITDLVHIAPIEVILLRFEHFLKPLHM